MKFNKTSGPHNWTHISHPLVTTTKPINSILDESDYSGDNYYNLLAAGRYIVDQAD